ncbi:MAG: YraN family protein [Kordiimonadaceae bacterium]|nr:YraN family protein [Kordiimonadaceae bacterium]
MKPTRSKRQQSEKHGKHAEAWAALYLLLKGYRTLERRFRSKRGEVDLICKRGSTIVFVEVKARKTVDDAVHAVAYKQRKRIEAASADWLKIAGVKAKSHRFDMIAVVPWRLPTHIKDAWRP